MDLSERGDSERRHPWEIARREIFLGVLRRNLRADDRRVLDVGAGDSWFGAEVARSLPDLDVVCWDIAYTDQDLVSAPPGVTRTRDAPDGTFDVVLMMDVLEHIADPVRFLDEAVRPRMAPTALVLASVPAHPRLFGAHDVGLGHHRRYRPEEFLDQVARVCRIESSGPLFASLALVRWVQVARERPATADVVAETTGIGEWRHGPMPTALLVAGLRADAALCAIAGRIGVRLPGLSHWAVGSAPGTRPHHNPRTGVLGTPVAEPKNAQPSAGSIPVRGARS